MGAFGKDILRTILKERKRFIAIMVITMLGVAMFSGLQAACVDLRESADAFFDGQNLYDLSVQSTMGLTQDDLDALRDVEGVSAVEGRYAKTVYAELPEQTISLSMQTFQKDGIACPYLVEGAYPVKTEECLVTQEFLEESGLSLGDTFSVEETESGSLLTEFEENDSIDSDDADASSEEERTFISSEFTICGVVIDVTSVNNPEGNMSFRDTAKSDLPVFVLPETADSDIYTAVYLVLDGTKELFCYSEEYKNAVEEVKTRIEDLVKDARQKARLSEVQADAVSSLEEAEADAEKELSDAREKLEDGENELKAQLSDAKAQLSDAEKQLEDGERQLAEGERELSDGKMQAEAAFSEAWAEIETNQETLRSGYQQLEDGKIQIASGTAQLAEGKQELTDSEASARAEFEQKKTETEQTISAQEADAYAQIDAQETAGKESLEEQEKQAFSEIQAKEEDGLIKIDAEEQEALKEIESLKETDPEAYEAQTAAIRERMQAERDNLEQQITAAKDTLAEQINAGKEELEKKIAAAREETAAQISAAREQAAAGFETAEQEMNAQFAVAWEQISEKEQLLLQSQAALEASGAQLDSGYVQLQEGIVELESREADTLSQLQEAQDEIDENRLKLEDGQIELSEGRKEYEEGKADGEKELSDGWAEYEDGKQQAEEKFSDARKQIEDLAEPDWYLQDRSSMNGYTNIESDADSIDSIATVFPVIFFIVAVLISLTTITRMAEEDRGLIGTYKALGFSAAQTMRKYLVYALSASVAGSLTGTLMAGIVLPWIVIRIFKTMYLVPTYHLTYVAVRGTIGPVLFIGGILLATWMTCRKEIAETPAALMRPRAPKRGTRIFLERVPFIWKRLSFLNKVTVRNLFRYKKRMLMTVFGIAGCTALLLFGFAVKDSVHDLMPNQYHDIFSYDLMLAASADNNEKLLSYVQEMGISRSAEDAGKSVNAEENDMENKTSGGYMNLEIQSVSLSCGEENMQNGNNSQTVQMMIVPDGEKLSAYIHLYDLDGNPLTLKDDQIVITRNAGSVLGFQAGDTVRVQQADLQQADLTVTNLCENYLGNYIYMTQTAYEKAFDEYKPNAVLLNFPESCTDQVAAAAELSKKDGVVACVSTQELEDDFSGAFALINMVVYVIILMSAALAFVVLFTLSTTNISERERELATIKVLGFYDWEVHLYVDKETMLLTVIGIAAGLPLGRILGQTLTLMLNLPSVYLATVLHPISYLYAAVLGIIFALFVNCIMGRTMDRIDPAVSLKSVE